MSNTRHATTTTTFEQADSPVVVPVNNLSDFYQVTSFAASNTGVLTFRGKTTATAPFEQITDIDTGLIETIDLSTDIKTWQTKAYLVELEVTATGLVGEASLILQSGDD